MVLAFPITDADVLALVCSKHTGVQCCAEEVYNSQHWHLGNIWDTFFHVSRRCSLGSFLSLSLLHYKKGLFVFCLWLIRNAPLKLEMLLIWKHTSCYIDFLKGEREFGVWSWSRTHRPGNWMFYLAYPPPHEKKRFVLPHHKKWENNKAQPEVTQATCPIAARIWLPRFYSLCLNRILTQVWV